MFCLRSTGFQLIARRSVSVDQDGLVSSEKLTTLKKPNLFISVVQKDVFASRNFSLPYSIYTLGSYIYLLLYASLVLCVLRYWCPIERYDLGIWLSLINFTNLINPI